MKKEERKNAIDKELKNLVGASQMMSQEQVTNKIVEIVKKYYVKNIFHRFENGLLVIMDVDYAI